MRSAAQAAFLGRHGWADGQISLLAADASFRRYFRVSRRGSSVVLMDAPPDREKLGPFVTIARLLQGLGYSAPAILAEDRQNGFLLLEDLGDRTYTRLIVDGTDEEPLYALAIDLLADLHTRTEPVEALAPYDDARFLDEATLLVDWFLPPAAAALRADYRERWHTVLLPVHAMPRSLVLRDYHVDNLMLLDRPGLAACGLLDFQDALWGPIAYDVVSLLEDARRDVADMLRLGMVERYLDASPAVSRPEFEQAMAILGGQRHAKVVGIFSRLAKRDGKPGYLKHLPRLWRLLERSCQHPSLAPVAEWLERHVPRAEREAA